jgi:hypothetical protein
MIAQVSDNSLPYCAYMHDHRSCPFYTTELNVISSVEIAVTNTSGIEQFQLTYAPLLNFFDNQHVHVFTINNTTNNTVVNEIVIPANEHDYDQAKTQAEQVFQEYLLAFADNQQTASTNETSITIGTTPAPIAPNAYFSHILSLT